MHTSVLKPTNQDSLRMIVEEVRNSVTHTPVVFCREHFPIRYRNQLTRAVEWSILRFTRVPAGKRIVNIDEFFSIPVIDNAAPS